MKTLMTYMRIMGCLFITTLILSSCFSKPDEPSSDMPTASTSTDSGITAFDTFLDDAALIFLTDSPLNASFKFGDLDALGLDDLNSDLDDYSTEALDASLNTFKGLQTSLLEWDYETLSLDQQLSYDMLNFHLDLLITSVPYQYYVHHFQPSTGIQAYLPIALIQLPLNDTTAINHYISRLEKVPRLLDQLSDHLRIQIDEGLLLPSELYTQVIEQIEPMIQNAYDHMIYVYVSEATEDASIHAQVFDLLQNQIFPAYGRIIDVLALAAEVSTVQTGITAYPAGTDYYTYLLKSKTSYDISIEDYEQFIMTEMTRMSTRLQALIAQNPELESMDLENLLPEFEDLDTLRQYQLAVLESDFYDYGINHAVAKTIPDYLADDLPGGFYYPVAIDGKAYGNMYLSADFYETPDATTLELLFHEDIPGHHLYFSKLYASELPLIRKLLSWLPFEEGWAVNMQLKAYESMGLEDPLPVFFKTLSSYQQYFYAYMDLQLHVHGVGYEEMIQQYTAMGYPEDHAKDMVTRMVANPGEAIHYVYGYHKLNAYFIEGQKALGEDYDAKAFHHLLLSEGSLPFFLMDQVVADYLD